MTCFTGSPFQFLVTDLSKVTVRGDGLGSIKAGQLSTFLLTAPTAQLKDIDVRIMGMLRSNIRII